MATYRPANPGDQTNAEGDAVSLPVEVSDNTTETLTFGATGLPAGLTIDPASGLISGTVQSLDANGSPYNVTVTAANGTASDSQSFQWTITDLLVNNPGDQIDARDDAVNLAVQAVDPAGATLAYGAAGLPGGLTIDAATGVISGVVSPTDSGAYAVTVSASDADHTASQSFTWTVTNGALYVLNPGTQTNAEGDAVALQITATPPAGASVDSFTALGLPTGLAIDPDTGLISGTVDSAAAETNGGVYQVTVMADDGQGDTGSQTFAWDVSHTDQAPVVSNPGDQFDHTGDVASLPIDGYDPDAGDVLTWSASGLPVGLSIDSATGIISGTLDASVTGSFGVTVTASDGTLSAAQGFTWFVANGQLTLATPADQTNTEGDIVSLALQATDPNGSVGLTYTVSGLPDGLTYNATSGLISGTVAVGAAADGFGGQYVVTASADDGAGDNAAVQFGWTVAAADLPPTLTNPGNQTNVEGDAVSLQIQATDPEGNLLTYSASGLPAGLNIDPDSGLISGDISTLATQAATNYTTTVAVYDGDGHTVSQTFQWAVSHLTQPPWLSNPLMQINQVGDIVALQLQAGDADGGALAYSAVGLPTGLFINGATGLIYGTAVAAGSYDPTVTAAERALTATQQFAWTVSLTATPQVSLWVNGTETRTDDVALLGAAPIPVVVTLQDVTPGLHEVYLQLPPSDDGRASLDQTTLWLVDGGSQTVMLTALQGSAAEDDVQIVAFADPNPAAPQPANGQAKLTIEVVTIPQDVKAADTPTGMADRIPPRVETSLPVSLSVALTEGQRINFKVIGQSANNGTVKLVDATNTDTDQLWTDVKGVTYVRIRGITQTAPTADGKGGNAGNLQLEAFVGGNENSNKKSNGFSVAAIPIQVIASKATKVEGQLGEGTNLKGDPAWIVTWGAHYVITIKSDSGVTADLGAVKISEKIVPKENTGKAAEVGKFELATDPIQDTNGEELKIGKVRISGKAVSAETAKEKAPGFARAKINAEINAAGEFTEVSEQYVVFTDARTGMTDENHPLVVNQSGFELTYVEQKATDANGKTIYSVRVKRTAMANNGAAAGIVSDDAAQEVTAEIE